MKLFRGCLSGLFLVVALALSVCESASLANAQNAPPNPNIVVEGARGDADAIRGYFSGTDQASVNRAVDDLSATGMFSKVSAKIVDGKVVVTVVESGQVVNRIAFEGDLKLKSDQLAVEVQSKARAAFDPAIANADVDRIKEAYKKIGYNDTKVTYRLVNLPNGRVDLVFTIVESDKTGVRSINFVGNNAISSYRLHGLMQTTEMNFLSWFKSSDVYQPDTLAADEEAIRKYYMKNGYADFRITDTNVVYDPDKKGYIITITVSEGTQYHVSGVTVTSHLAKVSSESLERFVLLRAGDVYNASAVEKSVEAMTRQLARLGYAFSDVRPHGDRNDATHQIALAFTVDDGPKVYIERMDIVGNTRTRDYVIRREFDIGEGDPYNHTLIEQGERHLNNLGFFKTVHVSTRPGSSPDRIIVTIAVEDKPTGSISLSGGYSTTEGFLAEVAFTETNFLGRGQYVRASVSEGQYANGWGLTFTEPYFLDQHLAAGFDLFHKQQLENQFALYETSTTGVNLRLGIPVTDELTFQPNYSIYEAQIQIPNTTNQPFDDCQPPNQTDFTPGGTHDSYPGDRLRQLFAQRRSVARDQASGGGGRDRHLARRLLADLGQPGQPQGSQQRDLCEFPPGHRGCGRQFGVHPRDGRWPLLLPDHGRYRRTSAWAGRPDHGLRGGSELADHQQLQSRPDLGSRLRAGRDRSSRYIESHQYLGQRPGRHHLFRRLGRGAISVVRTAQGTGPEGRVLRRCGNVVRLYGRDELLPARRAASRHSMPDCVGQCDTSRKATASRSTTSAQFAPRSARAFFGRRLSVRSG